MTNATSDIVVVCNFHTKLVMSRGALAQRLYKVTTAQFIHFIFSYLSYSPPKAAVKRRVNCPIKFLIRTNKIFTVAPSLCEINVR